MMMMMMMKVGFLSLWILCGVFEPIASVKAFPPPRRRRSDEHFLSRSSFDSSISSSSYRAGSDWGNLKPLLSSSEDDTNSIVSASSSSSNGANNNYKSSQSWKSYLTLPSWFSFYKPSSKKGYSTQDSSSSVSYSPSGSSSAWPRSRSTTSSSADFNRNRLVSSSSIYDSYFNGNGNEHKHENEGYEEEEEEDDDYEDDRNRLFKFDEENEEEMRGLMDLFARMKFSSSKSSTEADEQYDSNEVGAASSSVFTGRESLLPLQDLPWDSSDVETLLKVLRNRHEVLRAIREYGKAKEEDEDSRSASDEYKFEQDFSESSNNNEKVDDESEDYEADDDMSENENNLHSRSNEKFHYQKLLDEMDLYDPSGSESISNEIEKGEFPSDGPKEAIDVGNPKVDESAQTDPSDNKDSTASPVLQKITPMKNDIATETETDSKKEDQLPSDLISKPETTAEHKAAAANNNNESRSIIIYVSIAIAVLTGIVSLSALVMVILRRREDHLNSRKFAFPVVQTVDRRAFYL